MDWGLKRAVLRRFQFHGIAGHVAVDGDVFIAGHGDVAACGDGAGKQLGRLVAAQRDVDAGLDFGGRHAIADFHGLAMAKSGERDIAGSWIGVVRRLGDDRPAVDVDVADGLGVDRLRRGNRAVVAHVAAGYFRTFADGVGFSGVPAPLEFDRGAVVGLCDRHGFGFFAFFGKFVRSCDQSDVGGIDGAGV